MNAKERLQRQGIEVRRYEYDDQTALVADFDPSGEQTVEVVGDTVIVIDGGEQYEVTIDGDAQAFMNNGVLTIEVNQ